MLSRVIKPVGLSVCTAACGPSLMPSLGSITLIIGKDLHDLKGYKHAKAFTRAIQEIKSPINTIRLKLQFRNFCFHKGLTPRGFAAAIGSKIKVNHLLEMTGADYHWECDLRAIPRTLFMKIDPLTVGFTPRDTANQRVGFFGCLYKAAKTDFELLGLDEAGVQLPINDPGVLYEKWCEENGILI